MANSDAGSGRVRRLLTAFTDPTTPQHVVGTSVLWGLLTLPNPATQNVFGKLAVRVGTAALSGVVVWVGLRDLENDFFQRPLRRGLTAVGVGAAFAVGDASDAIDAKLHRALVRRGVTHPRRVLACAAAALAAMSQLRRREEPTAALDDTLHDDGPVTVAMPPEVRALLSALLLSSDEGGAPQLRAQLADATATEYLGEVEDAFYPGIGFVVSDSAPRAVPYYAQFPVVGRYYPFDGRSAEVSLTIADGRIANLNIGPGSDWTPEEQVAWMDAGGSVQDISCWPEPVELTFLAETPRGLTEITPRGSDVVDEHAAHQ